MGENIALTIIVVIVGLGLLYFLLDKLAKTKADEKIGGLKDYLLILKKSIFIIKDNRWMFWIPMGIVLVSSLLGYLSVVSSWSRLLKQNGIPWFGFDISKGWAGFISFFQNAHAVRYIMEIYGYFILPGGQGSIPLVLALIIIFGYFKFKTLTGSVRVQGGASVFQAMRVPVVIFSILTVAAYIVFLVKFPGNIPYANVGIVFSLPYHISFLCLVNLYFAFFYGTTILIVRNAFRLEGGNLPVEKDEIFLVAEKLFYYFLILRVIIGTLGLLCHHSPSRLLPVLYDVVFIAIALIFLFVPLEIAVEGKGMMEAIRGNWKFWKREDLQIRLFLLMFTVLSVIVSSFAQLFGQSFYSIARVFANLIVIAITIFFNLVLVVCLAGFYVRLADSKSDAQ